MSSQNQRDKSAIELSNELNKDNASIKAAKRHSADVTNKEDRD
jgi:hypothetical protein